MFHQRVTLLTTGVLMIALMRLSYAANLTFTDSECVLTDIESRLSIASDIIETARQKIPKDLKELCRKTCTEYNNVTSNAKPVDCSDLYVNGERKDGLYDIWPQSRMSSTPLRVYCDMESNGGGWTVIQRRGDYKNPKDYFYRDWNSFKMGFGDNLKDFWIGNDNLFDLTNQRSYHLRINLTDWEENSTYAIYDKFWISDELFSYALHVKGYMGKAGDSLAFADSAPFSTKDRDNSKYLAKCVSGREGAWWYYHCAESNLNGMYLGKDEINGIYWHGFRGYYSLKETIMKIRPVGFNAGSAE